MPEDELLDLFVQDAGELLGGLEQDLMRLEESPSDAELLNRVFRAAHTIKGNAGLVALDEIEGFTHAVEAVLDGLRKGRLNVEAELVSTLLSAVDLTRALVARAAAHEDLSGVEGLEATLARLRAYVTPATHSSAEERAATEDGGAPRTTQELHVALRPRQGALLAGHDPTVLMEELTHLGRLHSVRADLEELPPFASLDPERAYVSFEMRLSTTRGLPAVEDLLSFVRGEVETEVREVSEPPTPATAPAAEPSVEPAPSLAPPPPAVAETPRPPSTPPPPAAAAEPFHRAESSVRVSVRVLDRLMTLAGEMVLTRNQLLQGTRVNDPYQVERAAQRVDHVTAELQDAVMATRMQSIRIVFDKFKRTVRDLATSLGKRVRLELEGEDVELDRTVIEAIGDPLSHLVRNAIGHGIELPDERMAGGKPAEGILRLSAEHKAGHVVIEVVDDGRGIDVERVVQRAIDSGVVAPHELRGMSSKWLLNLIFRPGVSTAHSVTRLSGRGVGLDAVHAGLSGIGGTVEVESAPGRGCTFRVKLPLTLAILPSLLVEAQAERFAIPQVHLLELLRIRQDEIPERTARIGTVDVLRLRGSLLPLVRLRDVLGMSAPTWRDERTGELRPDEREAIADRRGGEDDEADRRAPERRETGERRQALASALYVAVVAAGDHDYGIIVDHLLDSVEIVVKPLGRHLSRCACYAGATVLGDGLPALILDIAGLAREAGIAEKSEAARRERRHEERRADDVGDRIAVLLLRSGEAETLGVPLDLIERITKVERRAIETAGGRRVLKYRGASLPLFSADEAAAVSPLCDNDRLFVLVFRMGERLLGLLASEIIDSMETEGVIDELTHRQPGIFGSTFIGERLVLLVDPRDVVARVVPAWTELLATATAAAPSESHTVLVVEDSSFFLNHIAQMMEEEGYAVDTAEDGAVALEKLRRSPGRFDIVLTDIEMPVLDGFGLVERMRADDKLEGVPVIAITSLMDRESRERGLAVGIDEYTIKLDRDQVLERCRTLLAHGREAP